MLKALEVRKDIHWVGALDFHIRVFDIVMYTEHGTTYNSYVVKGSEKNVLVELAKEKFFDHYLERIKDVINPANIDYIVLNHAEPDHSGSINRILELCPKAKIVATASCIRNLKQIANIEFESIAVKQDDTIDIGGKTLKFIIQPFLHWPDTMFTYIPEDKTIFTCDSFGCHYADEAVFNDKIHGDFTEAYKYYFDCIMGPFKPFVLEGLEKIKDLDIETICNGHGPVIRENPKKYMEMYREWATPAPKGKPSVVVAYVSSYGFTRKMAETIVSGIKSTGDIDVHMYDMVDADMSEVMGKISQSTGLLLGSPTIVAEALPPIWSILINLNPIIHKGMIAGAFGSYGWSGEAVPNIMGRLKQLRFKLPVEGFTVCLNPSGEDLEKASEFGANFANAILNAK